MCKEDKANYQSINYSKLRPICIKGIQELYETNKEQLQTINALSLKPTLFLFI